MLPDRYRKGQPGLGAGRVQLDVLQQILAGPAAAKGPRVPLDDDFCEFYQANYGRVVAMATAMLGDRREAEDVAQEAFARALARWSRLRRYDQPGAWVRTVALRLAIDSARRAHRGVRATVALAAQRRPDDPEPSDALPFTALGAALRTLPLRERHVIVLHYLADLPVDEVASVLDIPVGTVKSRLSRGRSALATRLNGYPTEVAHVRP